MTQPQGQEPAPAPRSSMDIGGTEDRVEAHDVYQLHAPIMREKMEPRDGYEPVPLWLITVFGALLFWGGWYLATYNGGWRADVFDYDPAARFTSTGNAEPQEVDPVVLGEKLFRQRCVSCHQASGEGVAGQYPPLAGSEWVLEHEYRLTRILLHGLEGPIQVRGSTYNGAMPMFGQLKDEQIAAVLSYIRQAWGNAAAPIKPEAVAATRAASAQRTRPWSADELLAISQPDAAPVSEPSAPAAKPQ